MCHQKPQKLLYIIFQCFSHYILRRHFYFVIIWGVCTLYQTSRELLKMVNNLCSLREKTQNFRARKSNTNHLIHPHFIIEKLCSEYCRQSPNILSLMRNNRVVFVIDLTRKVESDFLRENHSSYQRFFWSQLVRISKKRNVRVFWKKNLYYFWNKREGLPCLLFFLNECGKTSFCFCW